MKRSRMSRTILMQRANDRVRVVAGGVLALCVFLLFLNLPASYGTDTTNGGIWKRKVERYQDTAANIRQAIDNAALKFGISTGVELDGKLPTDPVSVDLTDGTVTDVITAIMNHAPGYQWIPGNGIINIMPRVRPNSLLDIKIAHFQVTRATPNQIRLAIDALPEVKLWLSQNNVSEHSAISIVGNYGKGNEPRVSLKRRDSTLREIMDTLVTTRVGPRYWSVSRYGNSSQYIDISIE